MDSFEKILRKNKLRVTNPRKQIFTTLSNASDPLSHQDIYARCTDIDRASIYRSIDTLVEIGVVKVVYIGWKKLYELTDFFSPHHHHLRCTNCGKISHVSSDLFEKVIEDIANEQGFLINSHHFEIEGLCASCKSRSAPTYKAP